MIENSQGYFTSDIYVPTFSASVDPRLISSKARFFGYECASSVAPFTYGDFGCGLGTDIIMLAYALPHGQFFGFDMNGDHIKVARQLANELGLTNITFINKPFDQITGDDVPPLDFAISRGVISWISHSVRGELIAAISRCLCDTGIVSIEYQTKPGALQETGFRKVLGEMLARGDSPKTAFHLISENFKDAPHYDPSEDNKNQDRLRYLCHEFVSAHWTPVYPSEMADDFGKMGMGLCGPFEGQQVLINKLQSSNAHRDHLFIEDFVTCRDGTGGRTDLFSKMAAKVNAPRPSIDQEVGIFRLPFPISIGEKNKSRIAQNAFSPSLASKPLNRLLPAGLDGDAKGLFFMAFNKSGNLLTSTNVAPITCDGEFRVIHPSVKRQFTLDENIAWHKCAIVVPETALLLIAPRSIYAILSHFDGVPQTEWPDRLKKLIPKLKKKKAKRIVKIWREHWAPVLAAHGVIAPLD
ncbi:hypothetical protein GCM10008927_25660 [Amylibacter ulvae]|uniref:Methyltransferase domain-containing protein n=1 Tax=Paramylibacter ulvae TaxID=1651968 RepID=A0ABQ3D8W8_9RHOB|nr:class I SAM-dependent methyltransferase [Amylibacter ulvae]GHA58868.1 hypothetical protein GCM10008927_25660 [Amylibacter ulvae]